MDSAKDKEEQYECVSNAGLVFRALTLMKNQHTFLHLTIPDVSGTPTSTVIATYQDQGFFVLDELQPAIMENHLIKGLDWEFHCSADGIDTRFQAEFQGRGVNNGLPYYRFGLPPKIWQLQRRTSYRVPVDMMGGCTVEIDIDGTLYSGEIVDLSLGGTALRFKKSLPEELAAGYVMTDVMLHLLGETRVKVPLEIRHRKKDKGVTRLGCQFKDPGRAVQAELEKYIFRLDREHRQKTRKLAK